MAAPQSSVSSMKHPFIQAEFNEIHRYTKPTKPGFKQTVRECLKCSPLNFIYHLFPVLVWMPNYKWREDFTSDLISGTTVAIMHIPQGMAYALLGGVAPVVGIYMAFFPVLVYVLMGTSRHISMGTFAVVCMMTSKPVMQYSEHNIPIIGNLSLTTPSSLNPSPVGVYTPIEIATAVCFVVGIWQILLGVCKLGILSVLFSEMLVSGFTTGAAVHVATSQMKNILGLNVTRFTGPLKIVYTYVELFSNINQSNLVAVGISAITIAILVFYDEIIKPRISKKIPIPVPIELIAVITGTVVSGLADLNAKYSVTIVGDIPTGLPFPAVPPFQLVPLLLGDGFMIAMVAFAVNMSMASIFARKLDYSIHANQELIASGSGNVFGSFFSCMPFAASLSRSVIQQTVGGKTQLASVVSCVLLLFVLLLIGPLFEPLPNCVLASIVVVALKSMFMQVTQLPRMWRKSRLDGTVWLATFVAVVLADIEIGLAVGIALSVLTILVLGQRPEVALLGATQPSPGQPTYYLEVRRYPAAEETPGICIIKLTGGLHFANCEPTVKRIYKLMNRNVAHGTRVMAPAPSSANNQGLNTNTNVSNEMDTLMLGTEANPRANVPAKDVFCLVLDMSAVFFVDPSAMKCLLRLYKELKHKGCLFCLAATTVTVYEKLEMNEFPISILFASVEDAVLYAQQSNDDKILL